MLHSQLSSLTVAFLRLHVHADEDKEAYQTDILSMCSTFAELNSLVRQLRLIFPSLSSEDASTTLEVWNFKIHNLHSNVKEILEANKSYSQDVRRAPRFNRLSVELVTIKVQDCAKTFEAELENLELQLRADSESPTNIINITQQEQINSPNIPSNTDQSTQCNIRTQDAENYRQELKIAKLKTENLKLLQLRGSQATSPKEAEKIIKGLIKQMKQMRDDEADGLAILDLEYHLAQIQMELGQYHDAETTARGGYDKRKELQATEDDLRLSRKQIYEALLGQKTIAKLKEAEVMYREVWDKDVTFPIPQSGLFPVEPRHWRLENGFNLGLVPGKARKFRAAEDQHREVMEERRGMLAKAHADTAQSAIEVIHSLLEQTEVVNLHSKILALVEPIWQSSKKAREKSTFVTWCGHKLGETYYSSAKFDEANTVLRDVWKARKTVNPPDSGDTMSTAKLLALSIDAVGAGQEADAMIDWICETTQAHPSAGFFTNSEEFQIHIRSLFRRKKFTTVALVSGEEWKSCSKRHKSGTLHESTLSACYLYGAAVSEMQRTTTPDWSMAFAAVQATWKLLPLTKLSEISTLKIYYLYAYMLCSMRKDVPEAIDVLSKVWTIKKTVRLAQVPQRTGNSPAFAVVLECCYLWTRISVNQVKVNEILRYGLKYAIDGSDIYKRFSDVKNRRRSDQIERDMPPSLWLL
ncbi:hypothetical protein MMC11_004497 [Xylographa trunciseda]|nr:hypothetical protein [Xylographa trunciseda]